MIDFTVSSYEDRLIRRIARRAKAVGRPDVTLLDWRMDITATHKNGCPLRLKALCEADDFNFMHDVFGIHACLDRDTGKLTKSFRPRYSKPARHA